jgi:hypothetical protein
VDPETFAPEIEFANSTNVPCKDPVSQRLSDEKIKDIKIYRNVYCHVMKKLVFF